MKYLPPNIRYLETTGVIQIRRIRPKVSYQDAMDCLARALMCPDSSSLKQRYGINKQQLFFLKETEISDSREYNIAHNGFFFSEYSLMSDLNLSPLESIRLKQALDTPRTWGNLFNGNFTLIGLKRVRYGLLRIRSNHNIGRVMGYWPIKLYFRSYPSISLTKKSGGKVIIPALLVQDFELVGSSYFMDDTANLKHFIINLINTLLSRYHLVFDYFLVSCNSKEIKNILQIVKDHYHHHLYMVEIGDQLHEVLYVPKKSLPVARLMSSSFGDLIYEARNQKHLTQKELAEASLVTRETISHLETGKVQPKIATLILLLKALDLDINYWSEFLN